MAESLTEFLTRRREEIEVNLKFHRAKTDALLKERHQLHRAAIAAGLEVEPIAEPETEAAPKRRRRPKGAIKTAVMKVLSETPPGGITARDILFSINAYTGMAYERSSLSPQLSRLKADGEIENTGSLWHMPGKGPYEEIEISDLNLFDEIGPEISDDDPEAHGGKATPGGGTR